MGLAISVGILADLARSDPEGAEIVRHELEVVNRHLAQAGLPLHEEPENLPEPATRAQEVGFPYSYLHYLRRVYAHVRQDVDWVASPLTNGEDPTEDTVVDDEMCFFDSHLLCHSDCEGYYLPVDFDELIVDDDVPGGLAGSSYRLKEELGLAARPLGIQLDDGVLSDAEARRLIALIAAEDPFERERAVWLALYEAARLSIEHRCAIAFN